MTCATAAAAPRPFTFVNDAYPSEKGEIEYEQWVTYSTHSRDDHSLTNYQFQQEIEYGVTEKFELQLYFGTFSYTESDQRSGTHYEVSSVEAFYYFKDAAKDPFGLAISAEVAAGERNAEFSTQIVLQKDISNWTLAYNGVVETIVNGLIDADQPDQVVGVLAHGLGISYKLDEQWRLGAEMVIESEFRDWTDYTDTLIYAGPALNYNGGEIGHSGTKWWATITPAVQLSRIDDAPDYQIQIIAGFEF